MINRIKSLYHSNKYNGVLDEDSFFEYVEELLKEINNKSSMKIYLIHHKNFEYDSYMGHVIVAVNEEQVRELPKKWCGDEGEEIWDTAEVEIVGEYTGDKTEPFILLSDFRAG